MIPPFPPPPNAGRPFQGALNFRDFGGVLTRDGRRVARGRLFRSDALWQLSDADLTAFAALGIRTVCDFRADHERERWPNRLPPLDPPTTLALGFSPRGTHKAWDAINRGELDPAGAVRFMQEHYRALAAHHAEHYAQMFASLLQPGAVPFLVHCASGKDRTGFAAAVILLALDVPRQTIVADYVLSDANRRELWHLFGRHVDPGCYEAVAAAAPAYLEAAFEAMEAGWGDVDGYLREAMRLDVTAQGRLRELLLE